MATSTGSIVFYDRALYAMFAGLNWTLASSTFRMILLYDTYTPAASHTIYNVAAVTTYEVVATDQAGSNTSYARQGLILANASYTSTTGTPVGTWDFTDPLWTANSNGSQSISAKYYAIYAVPSLSLGTAGGGAASVSVGNNLICYGELDAVNHTSVTTTSGNTLTINIDSSGFFTTSIV